MMMFLRNNNVYYKVVSSFLVVLPCPVNINYLWNFGFMLSVCLLLQIFTGFILAMHYVSEMSMSFYSVIHIMQDVNNGWLLRYLHMNGASFFFMFIYIHIGRGIYFGSYNMISVWLSGVLIFLMVMAIAFIGYVLPWGQMSLWGATVITSLFSTIPYIGDSVVYWIWGGFSVSSPTLIRFFCLHFFLPLVLLTLVIVHLINLHETGSSNPLGLFFYSEKISFYPYYLLKDYYGLLFFFMFLMIMVNLMPNYLGDSDNYILADYMITPEHIKPEWYYLFAYAILRSIPNKLGGVVAMFASILILMFLPLFLVFNFRGISFYPLGGFMFWSWVMNLVMLTWIGGSLVEYPYVNLGYFFTFYYFFWFFLIYLYIKFYDYIY